MKVITYGIYKNRIEMCVNVALIKQKVAELNSKGINIDIHEYINIMEFTFHGEEQKHYDFNGNIISHPKYNYDSDLYFIRYDKKIPHKPLPENLFPIQ